MKSSAIVKSSTDKENKTKSSEAAGSNGSSGGKKKLGLISSLYNNASNQITTEKDLYDKFKNNIAITPNDIMKLNKYTESI